MGRKVLLISHNPLGKENNMARTLDSQFSGCNSADIAQLFFSDDSPDTEYCSTFFRISDTQVLRSVFSRKAAGEIITVPQAECHAPNNRKTSFRLKQKLLTIARTRTPAVYCARNLLWNLGIWRSPRLDRWVDTFDPEVIYYASGDYTFSYEIAQYIAERKQIPMIVGCYDDFYIGKRASINPLYYINRHSLLEHAEKLFRYAHAFTAVSDMMTGNYSDLFRKKGYTLYTPTKLLDHPKNKDRSTSIIYAGNLDCGRAEQLAAIGRAVKNIGLPGLDYISVYSAEIRSEITDRLTEENGIRFCGQVTAERVRELLLTSKYVIHTESFDEPYKTRIKYSLSTKIADCLASGACIIAYGPQDVASISYLAGGHAAYVISENTQLENQLKELFTSKDQAKKICESAMQLAQKNHKAARIHELLSQIIETAIEQ